MLDIKFVRENPDVVKENIKKKFQDDKLPLVDEVLALDSEYRAAVTEANDLRAARNTLSKQVGMLMGQAKKDPSKLAGGRGRQGPGHRQRRPAEGAGGQGGRSWQKEIHKRHAGDPPDHRRLRAPGSR